MQRLEAVGIARDGVSMLLRESPPEDWGLNGGQAASDYGLGFTIEVREGRGGVSRRRGGRR